MRVINETNWRTDQLKKLAMEVAYRESSLSTAGRKKMGIHFCTNGTQVYRGRSDSPGGIKIKVLKIPDYVPGVSWAMDLKKRIELAQTLTWAIGVAVGLRGKDMRGLPKYNFNLESVNLWDWVKNFPIGSKEAKPKEREEVTVKMDSRSPRLKLEMDVEFAKTKANFWRKRLKAAMTMLEKYEKILKRAEKKLAEVQTTVILEPEGKPMTGRKFRRPENAEGIRLSGVATA